MWQTRGKHVALWNLNSNIDQYPIPDECLLSILFSLYCRMIMCSARPFVSAATALKRSVDVGLAVQDNSFQDVFGGPDPKLGSTAAECEKSVILTAC